MFKRSAIIIDTSKFRYDNPKFCIRRYIRCVDARCVGVLKENAGIAGGYVEALLQSPMPPMINADDVAANANFGIKIL